MNASSAGSKNVNYLPPDAADHTADDAPADPAITGAAFQNCSRKAEEAKPFIVAGNDIPDCIADFRQSSEN